MVLLIVGGFVLAVSALLTAADEAPCYAADGPDRLVSSFGRRSGIVSIRHSWCRGIAREGKWYRMSTPRFLAR